MRKMKYFNVKRLTTTSQASAIALCGALMLSLGGANQEALSREAESAINSAVNPRIPAEVLPRIEEEAVQGSPDAALRVSDHFGALESRELQIHWLEIAVENGNLTARFILARMLSHSDDALNKLRARYWYRRIITDGPADDAALAKRELAAWEEYERKYRPHFQPR
jgi:hypothetical protein